MLESNPFRSTDIEMACVLMHYRFFQSLEDRVYTHIYGGYTLKLTQFFIEYSIAGKFLSQFLKHTLPLKIP